MGDCSNTGVVTVGDLVLGVAIALGEQPLALCPNMDGGGTGEVTIADLITAVDNALYGCP